MRPKRDKFIEKLLKSESKNKPDLFSCQQITIKAIHWGDIIITKELFLFISFGLSTPEEYPYVHQGEPTFKKKKLILRWRDIEEVSCRKVLNLEIGIEIQTLDKRIKSFNLLTLNHKKRFFTQLEAIAIKKQKQDRFKIVHQLDDIKKGDFVFPWIKNEVSNQEFLLKINKYASRSFNDMTMYPIFPWVITDYKSDLCNFERLKETNQLYRNLGQPTSNWIS